MENVIAAVSTIGGTIDNASVLPKYKILLFTFTLSLTLFDVVTDTVYLVEVTQDFQQFSNSLHNYRRRLNYTSQKFEGPKTFCRSEYRVQGLFFRMSVGLPIYYIFYALSVIMAVVSILYLYASVYRQTKAKFGRVLLGIGQLLEFLPIIIEDMPEAFLTVYFMNIFDNPNGLDCLNCAVNIKCSDRAPVGLRTHTATLIRFIGIGVHAFIFFALKARESYNQSLKEHAEGKTPVIENAKTYYCLCPCYVAYYCCCIKPSGNSNWGKCRYYFLLIINMLLAGIISIWMVFLPVFVGFMFYPVYLPFLINLPDFSRPGLNTFLTIASVSSGICWGLLIIMICIYLWRHLHSLTKAVGVFILSVISLPAFAPFATYVVIRDIYYNSRHCGKNKENAASETFEKENLELQPGKDVDKPMDTEYTYNNFKSVDDANQLPYA